MIAPRPFLFFDLGNVIIKFDHEILVANLARISAADPALIRRSFFESGVQDQYERGQVSTPQVHQLFQQETGCSCALETFEFALSDIFHLNRPMLPLLTALANAGYRLGILSNTCDAHWKFLAKRMSFLNSLFTCWALSFELGSMKPEPDIYLQSEGLARKSGYAGQEFFFTDDRPENVAGAQSAGWHAVPFTTANALAERLRAHKLEFNF